MSRKVVSVLAAVSLAFSMGTVTFADEASTEGAEAPAGNSVAVGWPSDGSIVYYCGYMAEDPAAPAESQFSDVTYDQDGNNLTFHLTGSDGSTMDLKVEPIDEAGIHANITLGDDEPFVGSCVDLSAFPAYAEAAGITFEAGTEAE